MLLQRCGLRGGAFAVLFLALAGASWTACEVFVEPTPEEVAFRLSGSEGSRAEVIYARDFVSGYNEAGDTRVMVLQPDTVIHVLPIDTTMSIAGSGQWFVRVRPLDGDTLAVSVSVEVDGRSVYASTGGIYPESPWAFVYLFNKLAAQVDEVVF